MAQAPATTLSAAQPTADSFVLCSFSCREPALHLYQKYVISQPSRDVGPPPTATTISPCNNTSLYAATRYPDNEMTFMSDIHSDALGIYTSALIQRTELLGKLQIEALDHYGHINLPAPSAPYNCDDISADVILSCTFETAEYLTGERSMYGTNDAMFATTGQDDDFITGCINTAIDAFAYAVNDTATRACPSTQAHNYLSERVSSVDYSLFAIALGQPLHQPEVSLTSLFNAFISILESSKNQLDMQFNNIGSFILLWMRHISAICDTVGNMTASYAVACYGDLQNINSTDGNTFLALDVLIDQRSVSFVLTPAELDHSNITENTHMHILTGFLYACIGLVELVYESQISSISEQTLKNVPFLQKSILDLDLLDHDNTVDAFYSACFDNMAQIYTFGSALLFMLSNGASFGSQIMQDLFSIGIYAIDSTFYDTIAAVSNAEALFLTIGLTKKLAGNAKNILGISHNTHNIMQINAKEASVINLGSLSYHEWSQFYEDTASWYNEYGLEAAITAVAATGAASYFQPLLTETPEHVVSGTGKKFCYDTSLAVYLTKEPLNAASVLPYSIALQSLRFSAIKGNNVALKAPRTKKKVTLEGPYPRRQKNIEPTTGSAKDVNKDSDASQSAVRTLTDSLHQGSLPHLSVNSTDKLSGIKQFEFDQASSASIKEFKSSYNYTDKYLDEALSLFSYTKYSFEERMQMRNKATAQPYVMTVTALQSKLVVHASKHALKRMRNNKQAFAPGAELARVRRVVKDQISTYKRLLREGRDAYNRDSKIRLKLESKRAEKLQEKHQRERLDFLIKQTEQYTFDSVKSKTGVALVNVMVNAGASKSSFDSTDLFKSKMMKEDLENEVSDDDKSITRNKENAKTLNISGLNIDLKNQPAKFIGKLKKYQIIGFSWLVNRFELELNSILSDEMGLGKSVQTIAFFQHLVERYYYHGPFLVIAPNSLLINWIKELKKFVPSLLLWPYWGTQRERMLIKRGWSTVLSFGHNTDAAMEKNEAVLGKADSILHVVITSYQIAVSDIKTLAAIPWKAIVLDEAQLIKSSGTQRWKTIMKYKSRCKVLLSGTPIQNSLEELWALLHFVMPELFERKDDFADWFSKDIESAASRLGTVKLNADQLRRLQGILAPFVLRRVKGDVEKDLGSKKEIIIKCSMSYQQMKLYKKVQEQFSDDMIRSSKDDTDIKNFVMQLRKICCHPDLFEQAQSAGSFMLCFFVSQSRWHQGTRYLESGGNEVEVDIDDDDDRLSTIGSTPALAAPTGKLPHQSVRTTSNNYTSSLIGTVSHSSLPGMGNSQNGTLSVVSSNQLLYNAADTSPATFVDGEAASTADSQSSLTVTNPDDSVAGIRRIGSLRKDLTFKRGVQSDIEAFTDLFVRIGIADASRANYLGKRVNPANACSDIELKVSSFVVLGFRSDLSTYTRDYTIAHMFNLWREDTGLLTVVGRFLGLLLQELAFLAYFPVICAHNMAWPACFPMISHFPFDLGYKTRFSAFTYLYSILGKQLMAIDRAIVFGSLSTALASILVTPDSLPVASKAAHILFSDVDLSTHPSGCIEAIVDTDIEQELVSSRLSQDRVLARQQFRSFWLARIATEVMSEQHVNHLLVYDAVAPKVFGLRPQVYLPNTLFSIHLHDLHAIMRGEEIYRQSTYAGMRETIRAPYKLRLYNPQSLSNSLLCCPIYSKSVLRLIRDSGKLTALDKLLQKLYKAREPVLIYCQMTKMLDILEDYLVFRRYNYVRLDGGDAVNKRGQIVERFMTDDTIFVFLLSTRAASLGLNLTRASTVIFYENDWNPTQDAQAMDRVHRLGQKKSVIIYRLVTEGSIDEKILEKARSKEIVQELVLRGQRRDEFGNLVHSNAYESQTGKQNSRRLTRDDYLDLLVSSKG